MDQTQLAVIGAGPGGYAAAFLAADMGMQVTLIDPELNPGGVCLYRGCIPSKALLHVAKVIDESRQAANWGVIFGPPKLDLDRMRVWKGEVVEKLTGGLGVLSGKRKINYIQGRGRLENATTLSIELADGKSDSLTFEHAIIATGSAPALIPNFPPTSTRIWDSTSALEIPSLPKRLLVIGGGYIGLELGSVYASIGSKVTVVEMMPTLLPGADADLVRPLAKKLEGEFAAIHLETKVQELTETKNGCAVTLQGGDKSWNETFDAVLVSVGRRPLSADLGLENTEVQTDDKGFILVDAKRRTGEPSIYAIGDVAGEPMLAHKATHEGRTAVEAILGEPAVFEPAAIPAVVFTDPEIAWAGLTEDEAKSQDREIQVARFPWTASGRATTLDRFDGVTKLILEPKTERVLGIGMCGPGAGELIAEGVLAIEMAATAKDLELTIHPHPTLSETVMGAAEVFFGTATDLYRPRKKKG